MGFIHFIANLLKDPRGAIAGWIAMGVAPTLGFIFLIVFIETGVVFFPFLPGDSLLFAAGFFAAPDATTGESALPIAALLPVVWIAPILGDQCNYFIGHFFGRRIIESGKVKAMTPERLAKTETMIDRWGPLAVFLGRFFPFIRTFMPFISGITGMQWRRFTPFSVLGGLVWSSLFTLLGYFFGGIPVVQENFELVIVAILVISLIPTFVGLFKAKFGKKKVASATELAKDETTPLVESLDDEDEEEGKNLNESPLIQTILDRYRKRYSFSYNKINDSAGGEKLLQNFANFANFDLNVLVVNFVDMLSHARTESKMIRELAYSDAAYRALTESWFKHSAISELLKQISEHGYRVVLTTDHGTVRVNNPVKVIGDRATNTNLRYKLGKNLSYNPKQVYEIKRPVNFGLPAPNVSTTYIFATNRDFFAYPNNYNYYVQYYNDTFQHGGISLEEMIIPVVTLSKK